MPTNITSRSGQSYIQTTNDQVEYLYNIVHQTVEREEYMENDAQMMSMLIDHMNHHMSFIQSYLIKEGLKIFGKDGEQAVIKEIKQLHDRVCFEPVLVRHLCQIISILL